MEKKNYFIFCLQTSFKDFFLDDLFFSPFFQPDTSNEDIEITPENEYCKSHHMTIFVGCIYGYKGLLMVSIMGHSYIS